MHRVLADSHPHSNQFQSETIPSLIAAESNSIMFEGIGVNNRRVREVSLLHEDDRRETKVKYLTS